MKKIKIVKCPWCENKHQDFENCPEMFIHRITPKMYGDEYIIRGKDMELTWVGNAILIRPNSYEARQCKEAHK